LYVAARAYTWPVLEEQPPFEAPEGASPPLENVSILTSKGKYRLMREYKPSVTGSVYCWKRYTSIRDFEIRFVF